MKKPDIPKADLREIIESVYNPVPPIDLAEAVRAQDKKNGDKAVVPLPSNLLFSVNDFLALDIPERRRIVEPWLPASGLIMVYGWRGLGKTWFRDILALSVAQGTPFLGYDVPNSEKVLIFDGEMPARENQDRFGQIFKGSTLETMGNVRLFSTEMSLAAEETSIRLNDPMIQGRIMATLAAEKASGWDPSVIIFDNLSSMIFGMDESSNSDWDSMIPFLIKLRHTGYTIILIHHAGKNFDQRGMSRREDHLDTSISLLPVPGHSPDDGCKFTMKFTKQRGRPAKPSELMVTLEDDHGRKEFSYTKAEEGNYDRMIKCITEGLTSVTAVAEAMGVTKGYISRLASQGKEKGDLKKQIKLELTDVGVASVEFEGW